MKEWLIRIGCVCLGVILTLGTIHLKALITEPDVIDEKEVRVEEEPDKDKDDESESDKAVADYALEAELKFQELLDKKATPQVTPEENEESSENEEQESEIDPSSIESAPVKWIKDYPTIDSDCTLEEKLAQRSSYDETMAVNAFDKMVIENSTIDFSDVKITVIGDSITAGNNLEEGEVDQYNWPAQMKEILGCKEVVNLGIGGSTVSCCADHNPMCQRWKEIDKDSDIIIFMGGSNDILFENKWQFGELEYEHRMTEGTFCGDLDALLGGIKYEYRQHNDEHYSKLLCITPPSTILADAVFALDANNMVHQSRFSEAINQIAQEYEFEVIDLYNTNFLNSHDPDINSQYVYDGIHCNKEGYRILAEHIASQIIQRIEQ